MENQVNTMQRIRDMAPDFEAVTTTGVIKFSEYNKGNYTWMCHIFQRKIQY